MTEDLRNKMIAKARENGNKHGKTAELDFGAGAEWMHEQLRLYFVSQQRELLIAFSECVVRDVTRKGHEEVVDYFLKKHKGINCG